MRMREIMDVVTSKDGSELFVKVSEILEKQGVSVMYPNGGVKDLYTLCCDVAEVWNKEK